MNVAKVLALAALGCVGLFGSAAAQVPDVVNQEGLLYDAQARPLEGAVNLVFKLYPLAAGGAPIWTETHNGVPLFEGYYGVALGGTVPLTPAVLLQGTWLGIEIDGGAQLVPRIKMNSVPFALIAADLEPTVDLTINTLAIAGQPVIDDQGRWVGDPTGLIGPQGPQGAVGPQGARGVQGPQGVVGPQGVQGIAGVVGDAGANGANGAQGVQGLQGSPDTPVQVRTKLLTVDGAGSNVDADRLDGLTSGQFLRRDLAATAKPTVTSRLHVRGDHTDLGRIGQTGLTSETMAPSTLRCASMARAPCLSKTPPPPAPSPGVAGPAPPTPLTSRCATALCGLTARATSPATSTSTATSGPARAPATRASSSPQTPSAAAATSLGCATCKTAARTPASNSASPTTPTTTSRSMPPAA